MENIKDAEITLEPLSSDDVEAFIADNQRAFKYGALEEFGMRDDHLDADGEIISRKTIEKSIYSPGNESYRIVFNGRKVGGVVLKIDRKTNRNHLELFFVVPEEHGRGIGFAAWKQVEKLYPQTEVWETFTPYFEKRNIHFYINKCGFSAVEFYGEFHRFPANQEDDEEEEEGPSEMLRFEKIMKRDAFGAE